MRTKILGTLFGLGSFTIWSLYPLMWNALKHQGAQPVEILAHRIIWAHVFCWLILGWRSLRQDKSEASWPKGAAAWGLSALNGVVNIGNWMVCIWGATSGHMIDVSLGYFLAPLMAAMLGVVAFGERLTAVQKLAIGIATATVGGAFFAAGHFPWVALLAGGTASSYAALRKHVKAAAVNGTLVETALLVPCALAFLALQRGAEGVFFAGPYAMVLCFGAGLMTASALLLFANATRRLRLATMGVMQYIYPCAQLLLGVFFFHEPFTALSAWMFGGIVLAVMLYSGASVRDVMGRVRETATAPGLPGEPVPPVASR